MKKICLFAGLTFLFCNTGLFAQGNEIDAYNISNTGLGGTARSISMGGAFGALGGDLSVISSNPAGLGIYRSSEISGTLDFSVSNTSTNWSGLSTNKSKAHLAPNNFGVELYFPTSSGGIRNWNLGFSYNRVKNFNRNYSMENNGQPFSISSYIATRATNAFEDGNGYSGIPEYDLLYEKGVYDPYNNSGLGGHWLSILGYESGMHDNMVNGTDGVYQSSFGEIDKNSGRWKAYSPGKSFLSVAESGAIDEYNLGFGMNISDFMFFGASVSVMDINYKYRSGYEEFFDKDNGKKDNLYLNNWLNTEGTAASVNVGVIMNLQMLRLGVAYNSPRWYDLTDYYDAHGGTYNSAYIDEDPMMENSTPENSYSEYQFRTPEKWIFSGAVILGRSALISADYEIMNYGKMKYSVDKYLNGSLVQATNDYINEDYTLAHTFKIGAEIKINPQFAVRAGYMIQTSPMRNQLANNKMEVLPNGTIPHFTVTSNPTNYYTAGAGYRFTPNIYMDMACVFRYNSSDAYAFSNTYYNEPKYDIVPITSAPATLTTKDIRMVFTLGYKF